MRRAKHADTSFVAQEPVVLLHIVGAVLGSAFAVLVTRGDISGTEASTLTQQLAPAIVAGYMGLQASVLRRLVTPAPKDAE